MPRLPRQRFARTIGYTATCPGGGTVWPGVPQYLYIYCLFSAFRET